MSASADQTASGPVVLFFGRAGCSSTRQIRAHLEASGFDVTYIESGGRGEKLPQEARDWRGDYILCFRSLFFLPGTVLDNAAIAAVNFHPAPPEYPGSGCVNFALYDGAGTYGVTAHIMNEKIDNGAILEVRRFPVAPEDRLPQVLARTHEALTGQAMDFVSGLAAEGAGFLERKRAAAATEAWRGEARKMRELEALQIIDPDVSAEELERIIRATYIEGYPPRIVLHGYEFVLASDRKTAEPGA